MTRPLALVCSAIFVLSSQAWAKPPKVALTQIEGDASGDVREAVVEALDGSELSLISSREVNRAVDRLGDVSDLTEKDMKKLANDLEADAIVLGKLDKVGSAKTLKFRLYVHRKMAKGFTVSFKDARSEKFRTLLHDKMVDKLGGTAVADEERPSKKARVAEEEEDPPARKGLKKGKKGKAEAEEEERPAKKGKTLAQADEEERPAKKGKSGANDDEERPSKKSRADAQAEEEDRPAKKSRVAQEDEERPARKHADDEESRPADEERKSDDEDEPRASRKKVASADDGDEIEGGVSARASVGPKGANRSALRLDVGVSVVQRSFSFNAVNIPERPKNVALSPVPGARLEAELYPLALSGKRGMLAGLGLAAEYDRTLKLNVTSTSNMVSTTVATKQSHYSFGLRYRMAFGDRPTSPTLTVGAGYGKRLFSPGRSDMAEANAGIIRDTPNSNYVVIDPGLTFRFPVTRMVALSAGGRGLIITNAGTIQNATSYGRAKVYGAQGTAALDVVLGDRFALRFAGEFVQIGFKFDGVGELSNNLDGDATSKDVGGLADRSIGGSATLAVIY